MREWLLNVVRGSLPLRTESMKFLSTYLWNVWISKNLLLHLSLPFVSGFQPTLHLLPKWPSFPSRINKVHLITSCEISHLASIALQCQIAGGISADVITSQSLIQCQCARCSSTSLIKKHEALHYLTSAPAWRGDACLICWTVGRPRFSPGRQSNKSKGWLRLRWWWRRYGRRVRKKRGEKRQSLKNIRVGASEEWRHRGNGKKSRHCNLSLRTHI